MTNHNSENQVEREPWQPSLLKTILVSLLMQSFVFLYLGRTKIFLYFVGLILVAVPIAAKIHANYEDAYNLLILSLTIVTLLLGLYLRKRNKLEIQPWYSKWWGMTISLLLFFGVVFSTRVFLFDVYRVPSASMEPSIPKGSVIFVRKWGFPAIDLFGFGFPSSTGKRNLNLRTGSVYVYVHPTKMQIYIHRLVGLAGDHIDIDENGLTINHLRVPRKLMEELPEAKLFQEKIEDEVFEIIEHENIGPQSIGQWTVTERHIFVLGDNRQRSADSRYIGFISSDNLAGELLWIW